jgi:hypothetical protein
VLYGAALTGTRSAGRRSPSNSAYPRAVNRSDTAFALSPPTSHTITGRLARTSAAPVRTASSAPSTSILITSGVGNQAASQSSVTDGTSCEDRSPPAIVVP